MGGGGTPDFKWRGWSNEGKNQIPKKSYAKFPNLNQSSRPKKYLHKMHKYPYKMLQQSYEHMKQISTACIDV